MASTKTYSIKWTTSEIKAAPSLTGLKLLFLYGENKWRLYFKNWILINKALLFDSFKVIGLTFAFFFKWH